MKASTVATFSRSPPRAISKPALFTSAHYIAVAPCTASCLSFDATGAPPTLNATATTRPTPVNANATRAHLGTSQIYTSTPLPAVFSSPLPRRITAAVPLAMAPPPTTESFVSRHVPITADSMRRYAPVISRTVDRSSKLAFALSRCDAHRLACFQ
eukprot:4205394-Pleurochrysis_carterae.AAC.1